MEFAFSAAALAFGLFAIPAAAQVASDAGPYLSVGVDTLSFDYGLVSARGGYNFNEVFGVEGQLGLGVFGENDDILGFDVDADVDVFAAGFGTLRAPLSPSFDIVARGGYFFSQISVEATDGIDTFEADADVDGFAAGVGGQFFFAPDRRSSVRVEYTYLDGGNGDVDGTDVDLDGGADLFSLSYIQRF